MCGVEMESNPANMCLACLRARVDISEGIPKQIVMHQCRGCNRFLRPPWVSAELESHQLLSICLKKIPGLSKVRGGV
jgi:nonsense-mediated mRNA decay protein 3